MSNDDAMLWPAFGLAEEHLYLTWQPGERHIALMRKRGPNQGPQLLALLNEREAAWLRRELDDWRKAQRSAQSRR